jgi:DNA polymerase-4
MMLLWNGRFCYIDINGCYAAIECLHRPELRGKAGGRGGDAELRHGIILAKNELAKKYGIKTGEALWQARGQMPGARHSEAALRDVSPLFRLAREIYADYTDLIEPFGLDEVWADITGCGKQSSQSVADEIRLRVREELGITVSVGVSFNKIFAKLGSDYQKPDAVTEFTRGNYREKIWPLPAEELLYVGPATRRRLRGYGIRTIGQLASTDAGLLQSWFGKWGLVLSCFANGEDTSPVTRLGEEAVIKSIGNSTTTPRDLSCDEDAKIVYYMLCESVAERLRENGFLAKTVQIGLRDRDLFGFERQMNLPLPTCLGSELHRAAMSLLRSNYAWPKPLRSIGIRAADLIPADSPVQLMLFEDEAGRVRREALERTVGDIRRRFGHYAIGRAADHRPTLRISTPRRISDPPRRLFLRREPFHGKGTEVLCRRTGPVRAGRPPAPVPSLWEDGTSMGSTGSSTCAGPPAPRPAARAVRYTVRIGPSETFCFWRKTGGLSSAGKAALKRKEIRPIPL